MKMNFTHDHTTIDVRGETTLEALLLGQVVVAGYRLADPFQHTTPVHCRAEIHHLPTRKPLMRTPAEREAYALVRMLAKGEVSL